MNPSAPLGTAQEVASTSFKAPRISVCIVNYNTSQLLARCLDSVLEFVVPLGAEVIVVDNGSTDGSADLVRTRFHRVSLITSPTNHYFSGGVNQAAAIAQGEFLLFVNSDGYFTDDSVAQLLAFMDRTPRCAAVEGLVIEESAGVQRITARQFTSGWREVLRFGLLGRPWRNRQSYRAMFYSSEDPSGTWRVDVACNCFMLMRRSDFSAMGGADEKLLLYYTEDDWGKKLRAMEREAYHVGSARMIHTGQGSIKKLPSTTVEALYVRDRFVYLRRHHGLHVALATMLAIAVRRRLIHGCQVFWTATRLPRHARGGNK